MPLLTDGNAFSIHSELSCSLEVVFYSNWTLYWISLRWAVLFSSRFFPFGLHLVPVKLLLHIFCVRCSFGWNLLLSVVRALFFLSERTLRTKQNFGENKRLLCICTWLYLTQRIRTLVLCTYKAYKRKYHGIIISDYTDRRFTRLE